ncbi:hypothetical protein PBRA_008397, partial [Plasmodiophora brassicae]
CGAETRVGRALDAAADLRAELSSIAVIDGAQVVAGTVEPSPAEVDSILALFQDRDEAMVNGIAFAGNRFDTHRFYPDAGLVYGRRGDSNSGEGVCVHRVRGADGGGGGRVLLVVFTYALPTLSARAIPLVQKFAQANLVH